MPYITSDLFLIFAASALTALAASMVGNILLMRKMVLVSDSMPHIALPGIALGLLYHFNPLIGAGAVLLIATIIIWYLEQKTYLPTESIIGVLFVSGLAIGALLIPEDDLLEAFFGSIENITDYQALIQIAISFVIISLIMRYWKDLVISSIAPELAESMKINTSMMKLFFLSLLAMTVAIGIHMVGVLLMSALLIIPAVSARNMTSCLRDYFIVSGGIGMLVIIISLFLTQPLNIPVGILTVLFSAGIFSLSLLFIRRT